MKTFRLYPYSVAVLVAASLVAIPPFQSSVQAKPKPQTITLRVHVPVPAIGQPIVLPPEIPRELRGAVFMALENLEPGQSIEINSNDLPPEPASPPIWNGTHRIAAEVCLWWTIVIIAVVTVAIVVYLIYKLCDLLTPPIAKPETNDPPYDPYPA